MSQVIPHVKTTLLKPQEFGGLEDTPQLYDAYLDKPAEMGPVMAYAFGYTGSNILEMITGGIGNVEYKNSREIQWDLHAEGELTLEVLQDSPNATEAKPGETGEVKLYLEADYFSEGDIILSDDQTELYIKEDPIPDGNSYLYICQLANINDEFIEASQIQVGARFSKEYTVVPEASTKGGGHIHHTPMKLHNTMTTFRKEVEVTREAHVKVMQIELYNPDNPSESTKYWAKKSEWDAMAAWYQELDRAGMFNKYNKDELGRVNLKGKNGYPIFRGAGIREQIAPSNNAYYQDLTFDFMQDQLIDLSYRADKWGGNHKFLALTGWMGWLEFDKAVRQRQNELGITVTDHGTFISGSGDELALGGYFKTIKFLNGIELTVRRFPQYDDLNRNRELHPVTLKPLESYRFTIMYIGNDSQSMIKKVAMTDSDNVYWHEDGSVNRYSGVKQGVGNNSSGSSFDGYKCHWLSQHGYVLLDPTCCAEWIPAFEPVYR